MAQVVGLEKVADNITAMQIAVEAPPLAFAPGQYVALTLPDQKPRDYSLSWRSTPFLLEFFVRDHKAGGASSFVARRLRVDDEVCFDGPFGTMTVDPIHQGPYPLRRVLYRNRPNSQHRRRHRRPATRGRPAPLLGCGGGSGAFFCWMTLLRSAAERPAGAVR